MKFHIVKKKIVVLFCSVSMLLTSFPAYADNDPFEGWNEDNQESSWEVLKTTDWKTIQDSLTLSTISNTAKADVSTEVRRHEAEIRKVINSTDVQISDGLVELMLALLQVMGGTIPSAVDPYNVQKWFDSSLTDIDATTSIKKVLFRLEKARNNHPTPEKVSYFENSDELKSVIQSVMLTSSYTKKNAKYSLKSATSFYNDNKKKFEDKGVVPNLSFADEVSAIFKTTSNSVAGGQTSSVQGGANVTVNAVGTALGIQVVKYASQFIGNPYVYGGNSLTNGIDCSAFVQQVFGHFGYSLPRVSDDQASSGVGITFEESRAGDIIVYSGHVAILTGDGGIVHASNSAPYPRGGIKYSQTALYRPYIAIRRILNE